MSTLPPLPKHPALYQINTRVWLTELSRRQGQRATLDDIPDAELDRLAAAGFDWVWLLSVWQTGPEAQRVSRTNPEWRHEYELTLPDLSDADIAGSGFAITGYTVHTQLGGDAALARLRERLAQRGLRLMLDFVPNHMGLGHPWVDERHELFVSGSELDVARAPQNYTWVKTGRDELLLAHGRDPYFSGWPDTLQLNYGNPATQEAMLGELTRIAGQCDGVRCDMAMLVLPEVFERTWGIRAEPFWPHAIPRVRSRRPDFCFLAEVYWDLEWTLQQQGFSYTYDKRLYDRLREGHARPVREHLWADYNYQLKMARFLENHDEPRAAATFPVGRHEAAAAITFLTPGMRFFHQGEFEGWQKRISPHLVRAPGEPTDKSLAGFYERLLTILRHPALRDGEWKLLECRAAWEGNTSHDNVLAFAWQSGNERLLISVNYAPRASQGYVQLPFAHLAGSTWLFDDLGLVSSAQYHRDGNDLAARGLYLDVPAWHCHAFAVTKVS